MGTAVHLEQSSFRLSEIMAKKRVVPKVSLVITVLNEQESISQLLGAINNQIQSPNETIIVDGGSTDQTSSIISSWLAKVPNLRFYKLPGSNRSQGRNFGVSKSRYPIIAFTDAGCIPQNSWLKELVKPFNQPGVEVVSGYYTGLAENNFQKSLIPYVLVMPDRINPGEFLPSTRSMAISKKAWLSSGGFDPRLNFNEDYAYAQWLKKTGYKFHFAKSAVVGWLPRKTLFSAAKMFFYFSLGDIQAGILRPQVKRLFIRYLIFAYLFMFAWQNPFLYVVLILPLLVIYCFLAIIKNFRYVRSLSAIFWLPVIQITADFSVMWGSLIGLLSRLYGIS